MGSISYTVDIKGHFKREHLREDGNDFRWKVVPDELETKQAEEHCKVRLKKSLFCFLLCTSTKLWFSGKRLSEGKTITLSHLAALWTSGSPEAGFSSRESTADLHWTGQQLHVSVCVCVYVFSMSKLVCPNEGLYGETMINHNKVK